MTWYGRDSHAFTSGREHRRSCARGMTRSRLLAFLRDRNFQQGSGAGSPSCADEIQTGTEFHCRVKPSAATKHAGGSRLGKCPFDYLLALRTLDYAQADLPRSFNVSQSSNCDRISYTIAAPRGIQTYTRQSWQEGSREQRHFATYARAPMYRN